MELRNIPSTSGSCPGNSEDTHLAINARILKDDNGFPAIKETCYMYKLMDGSENNIHVPVDIVNMKENVVLPLEDNRYVTLLANDEEDNITAQWNDSTTKLLLSIYKEKKELVENKKIKTMKKMWELISHELKGFKYIYTPTQCENRWKTLERAYKNKILNTKQTGRGRKICSYEKELEDILEKRHTINPLYTVSSLKLASTSAKVEPIENVNTEHIEILQETEEAQASNTEQEDQTPLPKRKKFRSTYSELVELRKLEMQKFQHKKEINKVAIEQRKEIIAELKRRNDLLQKLLEKDN